MLSHNEYMDWWDDNTDVNGELLSELPEPVATLAAHVQALQARIDRLPHADDVIWTTQCACAYDTPTAKCMSHQRVK